MPWLRIEMVTFALLDGAQLSHTGQGCFKYALESMEEHLDVCLFFLISSETLFVNMNLQFYNQN